MEGPFLPTAGLAPLLNPAHPGDWVTLQALGEVHGLHKLLCDVKGIQATQLLFPEELSQDTDRCEADGKASHPHVQVKPFPSAVGRVFSECDGQGCVWLLALPSVWQLLLTAYSVQGA